MAMHIWLQLLCNTHPAHVNSSICPPALARCSGWCTLCRYTLTAHPSMVLKHQSGIQFNEWCQLVQVQSVCVQSVHVQIISDNFHLHNSLNTCWSIVIHLSSGQGSSSYQGGFCFVCSVVIMCHKVNCSISLLGL